MDLALIKSITIPQGVVKKITNSSNKVIWEQVDYIIAPITSKGEMPVSKITVSVGDTVTIIYYITENNGYIYDGRKCGLQYYGTVEGGSYPINDEDLNKECRITLTIPEDGFLTIGANSTLVGNGTETVGALSKYTGDIPIGKYIKILIE